VCDQPVFSCDLFPTLVAMAGLSSQTQPPVDGLDISSLLVDPTGVIPSRDLFFHYPHYYPTTSPVSAIRSGDWKLLEYYEDEHVELYNLASDPREMHNVAEDNPEQVSRLRDALHRWCRDVRAQMPEPNPAKSGTAPKEKS